MFHGLDIPNFLQTFYGPDIPNFCLFFMPAYFEALQIERPKKCNSPIILLADIPAVFLIQFVFDLCHETQLTNTNTK